MLFYDVFQQENTEKGFSTEIKTSYVIDNFIVTLKERMAPIDYWGAKLAVSADSDSVETRIPWVSNQLRSAWTPVNKAMLQKTK